MLSHKAKRPFKQYTEGGYSRWQELQRHPCTEGGKLSHKEDEQEGSWETSFAVRQFPAESLNWLGSSLLYILFIWTNLSFLFLLILSQPLILSIIVYMIVQLSKLEELPFKCSKQLHFQKCLSFAPRMEGSWVSNWELGSSAQYSENCACLKSIPTMGAQHIQCFSFPARVCSPNATLHEQQDSETQISSCICSGCLHFLASFSNVSTPSC